MSSNEWLPAQIPFDLVRRGFAPDQVTAHLERLEYDLRIATANGDATNQRLSEVSAQLHTAQAEVDGLRAQLDNLAREPVSMTGLSNRMQRMIRLAEEEAAEIRARANAEAEKVTNAAAAVAAQTAAEREAFDAERERTRRQLADQVRELLAEANADAANTLRSAQQQSQATLAAATAESERLLTDATEESRTTLGAARAEATGTLTSARAEAESLTAASAAERARLDAESNARRKAIDEDFEIAISSRRAEAHQRLTEREEISVADANNRIAEATAEAERRVQEATEHSAELIRRAAAESHERVADADRAVRDLTALRTRVLEQLASLREHLGQVDKLAATAPTLLDPPDSESARPVTADFPVDPARRPTDLPAGYNREPGPWDDVTVDTVRADLGRSRPAGTNGANGAARDDDALEALAADLSFDRSDVPSMSGAPISRSMAESDTDTFARITDDDLTSTPADEPTTTESTPDVSTVAESTPAGPTQKAPNPVAAQPTPHQRTGLRAFADRAMGGH